MDMAPTACDGDVIMTKWIDKAKDYLAQKTVRYRPEALAHSYRAVFDSTDGQIVLADLHRKAGVMMTHPGHDNAELQYATGRRDVVLEIDSMLRMRPPALQQIADMEKV